MGASLRASFPFQDLDMAWNANVSPYQTFFYLRMNLQTMKAGT